MADPEARLARHATCVAIAGRGVLIVGEPGSGKSTLALALLARGAWLVADDVVEVRRRQQELWARARPDGRGLLESRGLGILQLSGPRACRVETLVTLTADRPMPRLPELETEEILGVALRKLTVDGRAPGAAERLLPALLLERCA